MEDCQQFHQVYGHDIMLDRHREWTMIEITWDQSPELWKVLALSLGLLINFLFAKKGLLKFYVN